MWRPVERETHLKVFSAMSIFLDLSVCYQFRREAFDLDRWIWRYLAAGQETNPERGLETWLEDFKATTNNPVLNSSLQNVPTSSLPQIAESEAFAQLLFRLLIKNSSPRAFES